MNKCCKNRIKTDAVIEKSRSQEVFYLHPPFLHPAASVFHKAPWLPGSLARVSNA